MTSRLIGTGEVRISSARSSNGKWALVQQPDGFIHLFTVDGTFVRILPRSIRSDTQSVFSRTSPDEVFTVQLPAHLWRHNLVTGELKGIASFHQYGQVTAAHAEGDLTPDGWLALCVIDPDGVEHAFVYNVQTGEQGDVHQMSEPIDGLKAAYGGWLLVSSRRGIWAYPRVGVGHRVAAANGHACTGVLNGRPVLAWCSSDDPVTDDNAVVLSDIESGNGAHKLKSFDWAYAMHISDEIVSVYDPTGSLPYQIWSTPWDDSECVLLHQWTGPYDALYQPRASYSEGRVFYNVPDGHGGCNVHSIDTDVVVKAEPVKVAPSGDRRVDAREFLGKEYVLRPCPDGHFEMFERQA